MAWDKAEPQDPTKIRTLGTVITPNWAAIEQAEVSFQPDGLILTDRNPLGVANDAPAAVAATATSRGNGFTLYSKQDGDGKAQLYGIDLDGIISQFTDSRKDLSQTGHAVIPPGILLQWGRDTTAAGLKTVTFPKVFSATPWVVFATPYANYITGSTPNPFGAQNITATTAQFGGLNAGNVAGKQFGWIAVGPA